MRLVWDFITEQEAVRLASVNFVNNDIKRYISRNSLFKQTFIRDLVCYRANLWRVFLRVGELVFALFGQEDPVAPQPYSIVVVVVVMVHTRSFAVWDHFLGYSLETSGAMAGAFTGQFVNQFGSVALAVFYRNDRRIE